MSTSIAAPWLSRRWAGLWLVAAVVLAAVLGGATGSPWLAFAIPVGVGGAVLWLRSPQWLWVALLALTPLSFEVEVAEGTALTLPTDILALLTMLASWLLWGRYWRALQRYLHQPLAWVLIGVYVWMLVATVTSVTPVRSLKFLALITWQAGAFLLFPLVLFHKRPEWVHRWWLFVVPSALVTWGYVTARHAASGFSFDESSNIVQPFFFDHGPYATFLAFVAVLLGVYGLSEKRWRWLRLVVAVLLLSGVVFSFSRASWLGVVLAVGLWLLLQAVRRAPKATLVGFLVLVVGGAFRYSSNLAEISEGGRYEQDSLAEQFRSIFHTQGNPSNQERINRWVAALRMAKERPLTGFGPNSYVVSYDRFQSYRYHTPITTYAGDVGGAHSEPLTAAAELGYPGLVLTLLYLWLVGKALVRGYLRAPTRQQRVLFLALACAMASYFPQFAVNYLIDQDEISALVFLTLATLLHYGARPSSEEEESASSSGTSAAVVGARAL